MKKLLVLLVVILAIPTVSAYAASSTSRRFVVRNWKAEIPTEDEVKPEAAEEPEETMEPEETAEPEDPVEPVDDQTEPPDDEDESPADEEVEPEAQEEQALPVEDHGGEIEEQAEPVEGEQSVPDNSGAIEPEDQTGQEEPEDGRPAEAIDAPVNESEDSVEPTVIAAPPMMDTEDEPGDGEQQGEARVVIGGSEAQRRARRPRRSRGRMVVASGTGAAEQKNLYTPQKNSVKI